MCAIVDNNVRDEVFGSAQSGAGRLFYDWLNKRNGGVLVVGGRKLMCELSGNNEFLRFLSDRLQAGRARRIPDDLVDHQEREIQSQGILRSDDPHIVALARVSGARLLFTNDDNLRDDFKNPNIINDPRGVIYTTRDRKDIRPSHRSTLRRRDLCSV